MAELNESGIKTFVSGSALKQYRRVKVGAGSLVEYAGAAESADGISDRDAFAASEAIACRLRSCPGTRKIEAAGAITAGEIVYAAADGRIAGSGTVIEGRAVNTASGEGAIVEVIPVVSGVAASVSAVSTVTATGSTQGNAAALPGTINVVTGGNDTTGVILPAASGSGREIRVLNSGTAGLKIYPATADKINNGSANAAITILENTLATLVDVAADNWAAQFTVNS